MNLLHSVCGRRNGIGRKRLTFCGDLQNAQALQASTIHFASEVGIANVVSCSFMGGRSAVMQVCKATAKSQ